MGRGLLELASSSSTPALPLRSPNRAGVFYHRCVLLKPTSMEQLSSMDDASMSLSMNARRPAPGMPCMPQARPALPGLNKQVQRVTDLRICECWGSNPSGRALRCAPPDTSGRAPPGARRDRSPGRSPLTILVSASKPPLPEGVAAMPGRAVAAAAAKRAAGSTSSPPQRARAGAARSGSRGSTAGASAVAQRQRRQALGQ
jgi:hypothetical protein